MALLWRIDRFLPATWCSYHCQRLVCLSDKIPWRPIQINEVTQNIAVRYYSASQLRFRRKVRAVDSNSGVIAVKFSGKRRESRKVKKSKRKWSSVVSEEDDDAVVDIMSSMDLMGADPEFIMDLSPEDAQDSSSPVPLIMDRVKGKSDHRKFLNYFLLLDKQRSPLKHGLVGVTYESLRQITSDIVRDCDVPEVQAFQWAVSMRTCKPPEHMRQTMNLLAEHSISLLKILDAGARPSSFQTLLTIPPAQLEERILALKEVGMSTSEIEKLGVSYLLLPLQDHVAERLKSLKNSPAGDDPGLRLSILQCLLSKGLSLQCDDSSVEMRRALDKVLREFGAMAAFSALDINSATSADRLRSNLAYLRGPPLALPASTIDGIIRERRVSSVLTQFDSCLVAHHVQSILDLAKVSFPEDPVKSVVQKLPEHPGLLDAGINIEMRKALIVCLIQGTRKLKSKSRKNGSVSEARKANSSRKAEVRPSKAAKVTPEEKEVQAKVPAEPQKKGREEKKKKKRKRKKRRVYTVEERREKDMRITEQLYAKNTALFAVEEAMLRRRWRAVTMEMISKGRVYTLYTRRRTRSASHAGENVKSRTRRSG